VLLKNDARLLPLDPSARILVAGKNADNRGHQCGGFTVAWQGVTDNESIQGGCSIWEGIRSIAPGAVLAENDIPADESFDVAIVVIGERPYAEGMGDVRSSEDVVVEAGSQINGSLKVLQPYGSTLEHCISHPEDLAVIRQITARGIPVVTVFVCGRPLVVNEELEASDAVVAAWLPGSEGLGVAQVLFGEQDFQGRLSFSWPSSMEQVSGAGYSASNPPLFPVGYGLRMTGD